MAKGIKTGGRVKGTANKLTADARSGILYAAEKLGGMDRLVVWAQEDPKNEAQFWTAIYPKIIPREIKADVHVVDELAERMARARSKNGR